MCKRSNNKGYFLAETIVVIALVTSVMAYVFPNVTKVYDNYNNRTKYYDQTEDIFMLKAIAEYYENLTGTVIVDGKEVVISYMGYLTFYNHDSNFDLDTYPDNTGAGCKNQGIFADQETDKVKGVSNLSNEFIKNFLVTPTDFIGDKDKYTTSDGYKLKKLYITGYLNSPTADNYNFNKYLNRLKKNTSDSSSYRLIGVFEKNNSERYASIKVNNPNPKRNCNLGG